MDKDLECMHTFMCKLTGIQNLALPYSLRFPDAGVHQRRKQSHLYCTDYSKGSQHEAHRSQSVLLNVFHQAAQQPLGNLL